MNIIELKLNIAHNVAGRFKEEDRMPEHYITYSVVANGKRVKSLPIINFHHTLRTEDHRESHERRRQWLEDYINCLENMKH